MSAIIAWLILIPSGIVVYYLASALAMPLTRSPPMKRHQPRRNLQLNADNGMLGSGGVEDEAWTPSETWTLENEPGFWSDLLPSFLRIFTLNARNKSTGRDAARWNSVTRMLVEAPVEVSFDSIKEYVTLLDKVSGCNTNLKESDVVPPFYWLTKAGGLQIMLCSDPRLSFGMLGAVNTTTRVIYNDPIIIQEAVKYSIPNGQPGYTGKRLMASARLDRKTSIRRKGIEFDIILDIRLQDSDIRRGPLIWSAVFSTLSFKKVDPALAQPPPPTLQLEDVKPVSTIKLDTGLGLEYARLSSDYNPIHVHPTLAKLFGLKSNIAHGMCIVAACWQKLSENHQAREWIASFKNPIFLPGTYSLDEANHGFGIFAQNKKSDEPAKPSIVVEYK